MELDSSPNIAEVGEPSSSARARITEEIQSGVLDVVSVEGCLFESKSSLDRNVSLEMRTQTNISKRASSLKDARVVRRIARSIQLPRDRQLMEPLSLSDLLD